MGSATAYIGDDHRVRTLTPDLTVTSPNPNLELLDCPGKAAHIPLLQFQRYSSPQHRRAGRT